MSQNRYIKPKRATSSRKKLVPINDYIYKVPSEKLDHDLTQKLSSPKKNIDDKLIPLSETIGNIIPSSPRDLINLKSPVSSPIRISPDNKFIYSPRFNTSNSPSVTKTNTDMTKLAISEIPSVISTLDKRSPVKRSPVKRSPVKRSPELDIIKSDIQKELNPIILSPQKRIISSVPERSPYKLTSPRIKSPRIGIAPKIDISSDLIDITPKFNFPIKSNHKKSPIAIIENVTSSSSDEVRSPSPKFVKKEISARLPRINHKSKIIIDSSPDIRSPKKISYKDEFIPSIGDTLTRNGIKYVYGEDGWKNTAIYASGSEAEETEVPETKPLKKSPDNIPDYSSLTPEQQAHIRTRFNIKFDMLREVWPQYVIPAPPLSMPLEHIHIMYNDYVKHVYAREHAQTYMLYLFLGWAIMQAVAVKILKLPAANFLQFKMNRMNKYQILLIQLGEKYTGEFGEGWPIEIRILAMSLLEMVLFIAAKILMGPNVGVESTVEFISDLLDMQFGITGTSNKRSKFNNPTPDQANSREETPLPKKSNDYNLADWIPSIADKLGINEDPPVKEEENKKKSNTAEKVRARAANKKKNDQQYDAPPFES